jgi:predicted DNA-binding protein (UPF0251 family)
MRATLEQRFWSKVKVGGPDECWDWQRSKNPDGYGMFLLRRRCVRAHRAAYELHYGVIPNGMVVCHRCDRPACCNPAHLFLGTQVENIADMVRKGRQQRGERSGRAKLTAADVDAIRASFAAGETQQAIAKRYGVGGQHVSRIVHRETWFHVAANGSLPEKRRHLTDEEVVAIRAAFAAGEPRKALAERYSVTSTAITAVVRGKSKPGAGGPIHTGPGPVRLTEEDVVAIRAAREAGTLLRDLAARYGVSQSRIQRIVAREQWTHVP